MGYKCCVDVCQSETNNLSIRLHSFPRNLTLYKKWVAALKKNCKFKPKKSRVCSRHFEEKYLMKTSFGSIKLKSGAIPSIFVNAKIDGSDIDNYNQTTTRKHKLLKFSDERRLSPELDNVTYKHQMLYNGFKIMYHDSVMRIQSLEKESCYLLSELESIQKKIDDIENFEENLNQ